MKYFGFYLLIILVLLLGCAFQKPKAKIMSFPEGASVGLVEEDGRIKEIGQTHLEIDLAKGLSTFVLTKENFQDQTLVMIQDSSALLKVEASLKPVGTARTQEYSSRLEGLARDYPLVSVSYDFFGNITYLEKGIGQARSYYEKSSEINPENIETKRILGRPNKRDPALGVV
jgi:hypothetical protein